VLLPDLGRIMSAHHEAGHAVLHLAFGDQLDHVRVVPDGKCVLVEGQFHDFLTRMITLYAGTAAHEQWARLHGLPRPTMAAELENSTDLQKCERTLLDVAEGDRDEVRAAVQARTVQLVEHHWPAIERVATALERHGVLDAATVKELAA
jgi:hypothetical protein